MSVREFAKSVGFEIIGRLKRMPDKKYGLNGHYPWYMDEAGNEYLCDKKAGCYCIVTADGSVI